MTICSAAAIAAHVTTRLPGFVPTGEPYSLAGGLMNFVWRVPGQDHDVVVKCVPPHIAALPDVPLDPLRASFEAYCLQAFATHPGLESVATSAMRPPRLLDFDQAHHVLILEDVGDCLDLGQWLRQSPDSLATGTQFGISLGIFIGKLHAATFHDSEIRRHLNNIAIQESRHRGQYCAIGEYLTRAQISHAADLGMRAEALGKRFLQPGTCMIMGDLWPPSILMAATGVRIIDWEFAHFGQPAQDIAHLAAHLWMNIHRAKGETMARQSQAVLDSFLRGYVTGAGKISAQILGADGLNECAIHFGAEILARTVGVYQPGYLYDGLSISHPIIREAVTFAVAHIRDPGATSTFSPLFA